MTTSVHIADYDPDWIQRYKAAQARIRQILGALLVDIEHVGSTAVPGLPAKDIIDIMPAVALKTDLNATVGPMVAAGYTYCPSYEHAFPDRRLFRMGAGDEVTEHVHIVPIQHPFWPQHLVFRDRLRSHPDVRLAYEALKRELAEEFRGQRANYTEAKTSFIEEQIRLALED